MDINNDGVQILLLLIAGVICFLGYKYKDKVYGGSTQNLVYKPIDPLHIKSIIDQCIAAGVQPPTPAEIRAKHRLEWEAKNAHIIQQLQVQYQSHSVSMSSSVIEEDSDEDEEETTPPDIVINTYTRAAPHTEYDADTIEQLQLFSEIIKKPHVMIRGETGSGKSVLVEAFIKELQSKSQYVIIDIKYIKGKWKGLKPEHIIGVGMDFEAVESTFKKILALMKTRYQESVHNDVKHPLFVVVLEEANMLVASKQCPSLSEFLMQFVWMAREANMKLFAIGQSNRVEAWGIKGYGDVTENLVTIDLGEKAHALMAFPRSEKFPAVVELQGKKQAWSTAFCKVYMDKALDPSKVYNLDSRIAGVIPEDLSLAQAEPLTDAHLKVLKWKLTEPSISKREMVRRLYPNSGDGGGGYKDIVDKLLERLEKEGLLTPEKSEV